MYGFFSHKLSSFYVSFMLQLRDCNFLVICIGRLYCLISGQEGGVKLQRRGCDGWRITVPVHRGGKTGMQGSSPHEELDCCRPPQCRGVTPFPSAVNSSWMTLSGMRMHLLQGSGGRP